jgi:phosphoglycerol transferase MdoB-like AlkP superfamily enzyme
MLRRLRVPKTIQWIVKLFFIYLVIFTVFRVATVVFFKPEYVPLHTLVRSFWLGLQYDLRWIAIVLVPIACLSVVPRLSPFYSDRGKKGWTWYVAIATLLLFFFFGADIGNFAYNQTRLAASSLNFAEDPAISFRMIRESYPIVWITVGLVAAVLMMMWMARKTQVSIEEKNVSIHKFSYRKRWHAAAILLLGWFIYGFMHLRPLRWKDAYQLNDQFKTSLALNPMQSFFSTLKMRTPVFDFSKTKQYYPVVADLLQLKPQERAAYEYKRTVYPGGHSLESNPNVVLVMCESFSMYKSSMSGNRLNATPYFNGLTKEGLFFDRCFTPTFGTARGVFATLTGIPDVQLYKFSTRNEQSLNQRTIINDFEGYEKFYFLGGSTDFNNFRGLLENIEGVHIYEEGKYRSKELNVWGISDKNLFMEAHDVLSKEQKPFFAIIQTSGNHRPFTIPAEDKDFVQRTIADDTLKANGFESLKEFNAFAYSDYCFQQFMEKAKQSPWFSNTIFVFVGDHGVSGNATAMYPKVWTAERLTDEHVPLLFYAPALIAPQRRSEVVSQIDVMPTLAGMIHQPYVNTTLGRDLLNQKDKENMAFIIHHDEGKISMVTDQYYFAKHLWFNKEVLLPMQNNQPPLPPQQADSVKRHLSQLTSAMYETAKWMLVNNKKM